MNSSIVHSCGMSNPLVYSTIFKANDLEIYGIGQIKKHADIMNILTPFCSSLRLWCDHLSQASYSVTSLKQSL